MGTWGIGIFQNDAALDYIGNLEKKLCKKIDNWIEDGLDFSSDISDYLMGTIGILLILHEGIPNSGIVKIDKLLKWKAIVLEEFDKQIKNDKYALDSYKVGRRKIIENSFNKLLTYSKKFWN